MIIENGNNLTSAALDWADWTYDSHGTRLLRRTVLIILTY